MHTYADHLPSKSAVGPTQGRAGGAQRCGALISAESGVSVWPQIPVPSPPPQAPPSTREVTMPPLKWGQWGHPKGHFHWLGGGGKTLSTCGDLPGISLTTSPPYVNGTPLSGTGPRAQQIQEDRGRSNKRHSPAAASKLPAPPEGGASHLLRLTAAHPGLVQASLSADPRVPSTVSS